VGRQSGDDNLADWHAVAAANRDGILVLEDINEHPFRVERMLLQLLNSGILARSAPLSSAALPAPGLTITTRAMIYRRSVTIFASSSMFRSSAGWTSATSSDRDPAPRREALLVNNAATTTLTLSGHPVLTE
jgi:muramoyltetrapeptide carboxypeptidase